MSDVPNAGPHAVYAIADPARAPQLYPMLSALHPMDAPCLFAGDIPEELRQVAPVIFPVAKGPTILARWRAEGIGDAWGLFLTSPLGLDAVRRHVRRFLQVRLPDGTGPVLFRFWDPRVLHPFLGATEGAQCADLFARVSSYIVETPRGLERLTLSGQTISAQPASWDDISG